MGPNNRSAINFEAGGPPFGMLREHLNVLQITRLPLVTYKLFAWSRKMLRGFISPVDPYGKCVLTAIFYDNNPQVFDQSVRMLYPSCFVKCWSNQFQTCTITSCTCNLPCFLHQALEWILQKHVLAFSQERSKYFIVNLVANANKNHCHT